MEKPQIQPQIKIGGSAFNGNTTSAHRPQPHLLDENRLPKTTKVVSLRIWCERNFISKDVGYTLIKRGYLVGFRRHGVWWITSNPDCINELLEYLGVEKLAFDVEQD